MEQPQHLAQLITAAGGTRGKLNDERVITFNKAAGRQIVIRLHVLASLQLTISCHGMGMVEGTMTAAISRRSGNCRQHKFSGTGDRGLN